MTLTNWNMRSTALAAVLSLPFAAGPVLAQEATTDQGSPMTQGEESAPQGMPGMDQGASSGSSEAAGNPMPDALVATVGETEIRGEDVMAVVGMLPPQLQTQSPQMLVPIALEQLIMRELVLEKARADSLAQDPEVTEMVRRTTEEAETNAMVQVWLDREMAKAVSDEAVQQSYDEARSQGQQDLPPLEEVRPQIEQHLRQQAMQDIRTQLREGADVVLYDLEGQPIEDEGETRQGTGSTVDAPSEAGNVTAGGSDPASPAEDASAPEPSEDATQDAGPTAGDPAREASDDTTDTQQPSGN